MDNKDIPCKEHPDAPHGFMRDASHSAGRYVCECESWEPPKREWVGLTDEEVSEIIDREIGFNSCWGPEEKFARAIEQALKEKNT
jgi:hypothetical protein